MLNKYKKHPGFDDILLLLVLLAHAPQMKLAGEYVLVHERQLTRELKTINVFPR